MAAEGDNDAPSMDETGTNRDTNVTIDIRKRGQSDDDLYKVSTSTISPTNDLGLALPAYFPPGFKIQISQMPKPMPFFGPLAGYNSGYFVATNLYNCIHAAQTIQRQLTTDECNTMCYNTSKSIAIASYGAPLGGIGASLRWWKTRDTMRFPFYKPDPNVVNTNKFLGFRGTRAQFLWQQARFIAYCLVGIPLGKVFFASYAMSVLVTSQSRDSRLKQFWDEVKEKRAAGQSGGSRSAPILPQPGRQSQIQDGDYDPQPSTGPLQMDQEPESRWASDSSSSQQTRYSQTLSQQRQQQLDSTGQQLSSFDLDDASPVAREEQPAQSSASSSSGSAWERLRRGQRPPSQPTQPQNPSQAGGDAWARARGQGLPGADEDRRYSSTGDDLAKYAGTETEGQTAKERAQKDFDARLDRERKGGDFDGDDDAKWR